MPSRKLNKTGTLDQGRVVREEYRVLPSRLMGTVLRQKGLYTVHLPPDAVAVCRANRLGLDEFVGCFDASQELLKGIKRAFEGVGCSLDCLCVANRKLWRLTAEPDPSDEAGERVLLSLDQQSNHSPAEMDRIVAVIDALDMGLALFDEEDRLVLFNRRYSSHFPPCERDRLHGMTFEQIVDLSKKAGLYDYYGLEEEFCKKRIDLHKAANTEFEMRLPDSTVEHIIERRTPWGGTIALHQDVSDLHNARQNAVAAFARAKNVELRLLSAIEAMNDGFVFWDSNEQLVLCNSRYRKMYPELAEILKPGVRFEDAITFSVAKGMYVEPHVPENQRVALRLSRWRSGNNSELISKSDGCIIRVNDIASPGIGTVGVHCDITELVTAQREAVKANLSKSVFLANMSHEIRTPLTGIIGLAELIMEEMKDSEHRDYAANIVYMGKGLMVLLNDILDMSKLEAGKMALARGRINPRSLCDRLADIHRPQATEKGVQFRLTQGDALVARMGDEHRLMQILNNLLSNAIKFTKKGSVELWLGDDADGRLHLSVRDTGIGMTEEQVSRLFLPFEQAELNTAKNYGGTGLGMSIVADLVRLMQGEIKVTSSLGKGTRVDVWLSLSEAKGEAAPKSAMPRTNRSGRVLVADDNDIVREMLGVRLAKMGLDVVTVRDGNEALDRALSDDGAFDLILLDINMPDRDGSSTLVALQELSKLKGQRVPPVVAITANIMPDQVEGYLATGFADCIQKPFLRIDLERTIDTYIPAAPAIV